MQPRNGKSKFTAKLSEFFHIKSSKETSINTIDRQLNEEYNSFLKELECIINGTERSCHTSFKNDNFHATSSDELYKLLQHQSSEVVEKYISNHSCEKLRVNLGEKELLNYLTEIIVLPNKCNNKLCTCKPYKSTKEIATDERTEKNASKGIQAKNSSTHQDKGVSAASSTSQRSVQTKESEAGKKNIKVKVESVSIQTEECTVHPSCPCCSKYANQAHLKSKDASTSDKQFPKSEKVDSSNHRNDRNVDSTDASTSDRDISKRDRSTSILLNCAGEKNNVKLCLPSNIEALVEQGEVYNLPTCVSKKDCACVAYDVKTALEMGLVLPSSDICIQRGPSQGSKDQKGSKQSKKSKDKSSSTSPRSSICKPKKQKKEDKKTVKKEDKKNGKKGSTSVSSDNGSKDTDDDALTYCFFRRRGSKCDDDCEGVQRDRSMQTVPVETANKSDQMEAEDTDRKTAETSTEPEITMLHRAKKMNGGVVCPKCGKEKRTCPGCKNTIIIPCAGGSCRGLQNGETESLRMFVKMQAKDNNRRFDNIMTELNHQKNEIRRLNDMYHSIVGDKKSGNSLRDNNNGNLDRYSPTDNNGNKPTRRYGPPHTAVAINMCETCNVELSRNYLRDSYSREEYTLLDGNKQYKNMLNESKQYEENVHVPVRKKTGIKSFSESTIPERAAKSHLQSSYKPDEHDKVSKDELSLGDRNRRPDLREHFEIKNDLRVPHGLDDYTQADLRPFSESDRAGGDNKGKIFVWMKKSWGSIKTRTAECRRQHGRESRAQAAAYLRSRLKNSIVKVIKSLMKSH